MPRLLDIRLGRVLVVRELWLLHIGQIGRDLHPAARMLDQIWDLVKY